MTHNVFHKMPNLLVTSLLAVSILVLSGCETLKNTNLSDLYPLTTTAGGIDEATVIAGLKEALQVSTSNAVVQTSAQDGFLGNELIKIGIPQVMDPMMDTLRKIGMGSIVNELETEMNRAAEKSAGQVKDIFWNTITEMSVHDGFSILRGNDSAATEYFQVMTTDDLRERITPIVHDTIIEVGLAQLAGKVLDRYNSIPLADKPELVDLDTYVTDKTLDGLFTMMALEEAKIRQDPVARTTDLLRLVFGGMAK